VALPQFTSGQLEHPARIVGESTTGGEIDRLLAEARLPPSDISTKWRRIRDSFDRVQSRDGSGNAVAQFVKLALAPDRFVGARETHDALCAPANEVLSFAGLQLRSDGRPARGTAPRTLSEPEEQADRLKAKLKARDVHPDVLAFCRTELVQENHFHAVRGPKTFQPFATYPWTERLRANLREPVVEMAVLHSVPDAADLVLH
jgi:hypothetical protein